MMVRSRARECSQTRTRQLLIELSVTRGFRHVLLVRSDRRPVSGLRRASKLLPLIQPPDKTSQYPTTNRLLSAVRIWFLTLTSSRQAKWSSRNAT